MTAGIYAGRQGMNILLITKSFGGHMAAKAVDIENYPGFKSISGQDLVEKFKEHMEVQDIKQKKGGVVNVEKEGKEFIVTTSDKKKFKSYSVIVASGSDPRPLEVPGEKKFVGKGVSYCAICDGPMFRDKNVAVVGGGNSGFETAIFLANYVNKIYILEYSGKVKADKDNQERVSKTGKCELITNARLKKIEGKDFVESITYQDTKTKEKKKIPVEGVFVEIGYQPATAFVKGLVDFDERDEIKVEYETCRTKTPGLYAAGDANAGKFKQIITAAGEGAKAALASYNYLQDIK